MPRLPVNDPLDGSSEAGRPTVKVSWPVLLFGLALLAAWLALIPVLRDAAGIDAQCNGRVYGKARAAGLVLCSLEAGSRGWLFLGFLASYPAVLSVWLRGKFRELMAARRARR